ncbi:hypothetical protein [Mycobacterium sp.]|uniref:hypothetical protein n=1 Tax=Mycobacterium sp. TaxID=1785 RepID=UPI003BA94594
MWALKREQAADARTGQFVCAFDGMIGSPVELYVHKQRPRTPYAVPSGSARLILHLNETR